MTNAKGCNMQSKKRYTVTLDSDEQDFVQAMREKTGIPVARIVSFSVLCYAKSIVANGHIDRDLRQYAAQLVNAVSRR